MPENYRLLCDIRALPVPRTTHRGRRLRRQQPRGALGGHLRLDEVRPQPACGELPRRASPPRGGHLPGSRMCRWRITVRHPEASRSYLAIRDLARCLRTMIEQRGLLLRPMDILHPASFGLTIGQAANGVAALTGAPATLHDHAANWSRIACGSRDVVEALATSHWDACRENYPGDSSEMVDTMPPPRFVPYLKVNPTLQFVGRRSVAVQGLTTGWAAADITKSSFRGFLDGAEERDGDLAVLLTEIQNGSILTPASIAGVLLRCLCPLRPCCDDLMDESREIIKRLAGDCQMAPCTRRAHR